MNVRSRDSGVPSKGQLLAIPSVGFGLSDGFFVVADYGGQRIPRQVVIRADTKQQTSHSFKVCIVADC